MNENVEKLINKAIQDELRVETDCITTAGWCFLENDAPIEIVAKVFVDYEEEEFDNITEDVIKTYLLNAIREYQQIHGNIRYYE